LAAEPRAHEQLVARHLRVCRDLLERRDERARGAHPLSLPLELAVERLLELFVGDRAVDEDAVDEERRRAADARLLPGLLVRFDGRALLAAVEALVEPRHIHPDVLRVPLEIIDGELLLF